MKTAKFSWKLAATKLLGVNTNEICEAE